jgi:hypothetical protein
MQEVRGWSALETAGAFWPCGVLGLFVAPRLAAIIRKVGLLPVLTFGLALSAIAYGLIQQIGLHSEYWLTMFPTFALIGIAFGLCYSTLSIAATNDVEPSQQGVAAGMFQTSAQFGVALLIAVTTAVDRATSRPGTPAGVLHGYHLSLTVPLAAIAAVLILTALGTRRRRSATQKSEATNLIPAPLVHETQPEVSS